SHGPAARGTTDLSLSPAREHAARARPERRCPRRSTRRKRESILMQISNPEPSLPQNAARTRRRIRWIASAAGLLVLFAAAFTIGVRHASMRPAPTTLTYSSLLTAMSQGR